MADRTAIEWTDATWNPIRAVKKGADIAELRKAGVGIGWHCEHKSEGCRFCYAEVINRRLGTGLDFKPGHRRDIDIFLDEEMLLRPLRWKKPRLIFVGSMTDLFADFVADEWLDRIFGVMALAPQHTFQLLTKRPDRMRRYFDVQQSERIGPTVLDIRDRWRRACGRNLPAIETRDWPLPNVWLGTSVEDRHALLARAGDLRLTPAAVRFFSCEPLIGDLGDVLLDDIHWIIVGGESGPSARPMHPDWARSLRDQCAAAGVAFVFKQWGEHVPCVTDHDGARLIVYADGADCPAFDDDRPHPLVTLHGREYWRLGKKAAGRLLDGVQHDGRPA